MSQPTVYFASFLGDNAFEFYRQVTAYLGQAAGIATALVDGLSPAEQDRRVNAGAIQAVFTCGLPYVRKADLSPPMLRLIAAPVRAGARYRDEPVYFSDVIVGAQSPYQTLADLAGATFAYNETHSLSGYLLPAYHLHRQRAPQPFFGQTVRSGSHAASMDGVERGQVAAAAIDSVVLEMELAQHPERAASFRVIERIGPFPMPPVAASPGLDEAQRQQVEQALLAMHTTAAGQRILEQAGMRRFAAVTNHDYNPIRQIIQTLQQAGFTQLQ